MTDTDNIPEEFDASAEVEELLGKLRRWSEMAGDHNGPSPAWSEALELVDDAFRILTEDHGLEAAVIGLADIHAAVIAHHLG